MKNKTQKLIVTSNSLNCKNRMQNSLIFRKKLFKSFYI